MAKESPHLRLQQQIDCNLEVQPGPALEAWASEGWKEEPGTDVDEAPLRYMALILLDAIANRATRLSVDKDEGAIEYGDVTRSLPQAPAHYIARGLEILREITGIEGPNGQGTLAIGIKNDQMQKRYTYLKHRLAG